MFKAQLLRRLLHLRRQVGLDLFKPPLQQGDGLGDGLVVGGLQFVSPAIAVAFVHVEVQAGPLLADVPGELLSAGGQAQGSTQGIDDGLGVFPAGIGAEVPGPVLRHLACQGEPGIGLVGQADIGIALVVLEQDVIPGLVPLDEGALQHQGLELAVGDDHVEVVDLADHGPGLLGMGGGVLKILGDPIFQRLGFAHIDDGVLGILHDIYARLQGQTVCFFFQFIKGHGRRSPFPHIFRSDTSKKAPQRGAFLLDSWLTQRNRKRSSYTEPRPLPSRRGRPRSA